MREHISTYLLAHHSTSVDKISFLDDQVEIVLKDGLALHQAFMLSADVISLCHPAKTEIELGPPFQMRMEFER